MPKKIDDEKFIDLFLADTPYKEMARIFNVTVHSIYERKKILNLPKRARKKREREKISMEFLSELSNPYFLRSEIPKKYFYRLKMLIKQRKIIKVYLSFKRGSGGTGLKLRGKSDRFFNEGFYEKTFYCIGRTGVVRLLMNACKKPRNPLHQHTLTAFLGSFLSHAEKIAVLWHLGIQKFSKSQLKRNIQINGVYFPIQYKTKIRKILLNLDQIEKA